MNTFIFSQASIAASTSSCVAVKYSPKEDRLACPVAFCTVGNGTPLATRFCAIVRLKLCKEAPSMATVLQAALKALSAACLVIVLVVLPAAGNNASEGLGW